MTAADNAELVRSGYEAFSKGDLETVQKIFAPDIKWHVGGRSQLAGTYNGWDEVQALFGKLVDLSGGTFNLEIHDLLASDDHVVVLVKESATRGDDHLDANSGHVWHIAKGKTTEFWGLSEDAYTEDAFWG